MVMESYQDAHPSHDEDSAWCQSHGHTGFSAGDVCDTCNAIANDLMRDARMVRNYALATTCRKALAGDVKANETLEKIFAGTYKADTSCANCGHDYANHDDPIEVINPPCTQCECPAYEMRRNGN